VRIFRIVILLLSCALLTACSEAPPHGRWEALKKEEVYKENDHPLTVAFVVEKGEICAISDEVTIRKDMGYSKISCPRGEGWIYSTLYFKKLSD
jgi:hypothetical protein